MRTDLNTLNEIAKNLVDGEIKTDNIKDNIAKFIEIDNNEEHSQMIDDIIHDLESANIIIPNGDEYNIMSAETFHDIAKDDIAHINFASEEITNENGVSYTKLSPIDTQKEAYLSSDIKILGSKELQGEWDENRIQEAQNGKPHEYDFTKCENINLISNQLRAEIENTPGVDGFSAKFPVDKEILAMGGDMMRKAYMTDPIEFENGDAVILNGYAYTFDKELNGFIKEQIAIDTVGESSLESQIPSVLGNCTIYLSQEVADKVKANEELTPEEEMNVVNIDDEAIETENPPLEEEDKENAETPDLSDETKASDDSPKLKVEASGPDFMDTVYKTNRTFYEPLHQGDEYEAGLAGKMNELEQRRIEAESKINRLKNEIKETKKAMNRGPLVVKAFRALIFKPLRGIFRFFKKMFKMEINYSPEELKVKALKEELSAEKKNAILIKKESKDYTKLHGIEVEKDAVIMPQSVEPMVQQDIERVENTVSEVGQNNSERTYETAKAEQTENRKPNTTQTFAQTLQSVCTDYNIKVNAYGEKDADGKFKTAVELTTPNGEVSKFHFDTNKGTLTPVSFSVEQSFSQAAVDDIQKRAYIAYTIATAMSGKSTISDKSMQYINEKAISPLLNGERNEATFKFGQLPVEIKADENGQYLVSIAPNKETGKSEISMFMPSEWLSPENLQKTLNQIKISYSLSMFKSYTDNQFIDFAKNSEVIKSIKGVYINDVQNQKGTITFDVVLPDKQTNNEVKVPLILSTSTFSISCPDREAESMMNPGQKVIFGKIASRLEEAYASFVFSKSRVPVDIALPTPEIVNAEFNKRINAVEQGEKGTFFAYGLKMEVSKDETEYPTIRISTKDNSVLKEMPLYEQEMTMEDLVDVYGEVAKGLKISANKYDKAESAILNSKDGIGVGDAVLADGELDDFVMEEASNTDRIAAENEIVNDILATANIGDDR